MAFFVYILHCRDGRYYTGQTDDLERRIGEHQTGGYCDFTSKRLPVTLMWSETFGSRAEALEAEQRIKPWSRAKKDALIRRDWSALSHYAKPPKERDSSVPFLSSAAEALVCGPSTSLGTNGGQDLADCTRGGVSLACP